MPLGYLSGFRDAQLWADCSKKAYLLLVYTSSIAIDEPLYLVSNAPLRLDLEWSYAMHFFSEQLLRDQKSGLFPLESTSLRDPEWIDRLLLLVAIAVLVRSF